MEVSTNLYIRYLLSRNLEDIDQAVACAREAVCQRREAAPRVLVNSLNPEAEETVQLGRTLLRRFQHTRQAEDLTDAFERFRHALSLCTDDGPLRQRCFAYFGISYLERGGNLDGLVELSASHGYLQSRPSLDTLNRNLLEDDEVMTYFESTAGVLESQYLFHKRPEVLDETINLCRQVFEFFSSFSPPRLPSPAKCGLILVNAGLAWMRRFDARGEVDNINKAVDCCSMAITLCDNQSPYGWTYMCFASIVRVKRFEALGGLEDLDVGVRLATQGAELIKNHISHFTTTAIVVLSLDALAYALRSRYNTTGDVNDLDAAIDASSRALDITEDDGNLPQLLSSHLTGLRSRFSRSMRPEDLEELAVAARKAVDCLPPNHADLAPMLLILVEADVLQMNTRRDPKFREQAQAHFQQACDIFQANHGLSQRTQIDFLYAVTLFLPGILPDIPSAMGPDIPSAPTAVQDFESNVRIIDGVIDIARACAASVTKQDEESHCNFYLSIILAGRWALTNDIKEIDEAISITRDVIKRGDASAVNNNILLQARVHLGIHLYSRFRSTRDSDNREEALLALREGFRLPVAAVLRVHVGNMAIDILLETADWDSAFELSREVIDLFVILSGRSEPLPNKEFILRGCSSRAASYASISLEARSYAPEVIDRLEICRGSILGYLLEKRADLEDLTEAAPDKAKRFKTLQDEISIVIESSGHTNNRMRQITRRIEAEGEIRECLEDIRTLEGFHRFLLGPTEREVRAAAAHGPILIVNVSKLRSDAIIVTEETSHLVRLPELKYEKVQEYIDENLTDFSLEDVGRKNKRYRQLQGWLWDKCVKLILEKLEDVGYGPQKFHVWWMGVGVANFLPFHAAGKYVDKVSETALSRVISSYTPSLKVLIDGRLKLRDAPPKVDLQRLTIKQMAAIKPKLTLITMPNTPGMASLDGVQQEAEEVQKVLGDSFSIQILIQPNAKDTMGLMAECEIVHFACHGESNLLDPSRSHLVLQTAAPDSSTAAVDELTLRDVLEADLGRGKLAILSACSTAQNRDKELWDEALHLVTGFHVAGYLHAIGNLWPSDDQRSVELMRAFYEHLVAAGEFSNGDNVAKALNEALLGIAKKYARDPLSWAQYVHFGV